MMREKEAASFEQRRHVEMKQKTKRRTEDEKTIEIRKPVTEDAGIRKHRKHE